MRVILVDDEILALEIMERIFEQINNIELVGKFTNPEEAMKKIAPLKVEVVFLDMEMGKLHGLEFANQMLTKHPQVEVVFVTAYPQFALDAFEVNAIDYLLKPVKIERLEIALERARERLEMNTYRKSQIQENKQVSVKAFGSFRLYDMDGEIVKWRTRKAKELFAYLWQHENMPVHKERVIAELWQDIDPVKATAMLHTTIYQLRQACKRTGHDEAVKYANDQYVLTIPNESDLQQFLDLTKEKITINNIEEVLKLYYDDYLGEEGYPWAIAYQQELSRSFEAYLKKAIDYLKKQKNNEELYESLLEKLCSLNETNEDYIIKLINYYGEKSQEEKLTDLVKKITISHEFELLIDIPESIKTAWEKYL